MRQNSEVLEPIASVKMAIILHLDNWPIYWKCKKETGLSFLIIKFDPSSHN